MAVPPTAGFPLSRAPTAAKAESGQEFIGGSHRLHHRGVAGMIIGFIRSSAGPWPACWSAATG